MKAIRMAAVLAAAVMLTGCADSDKSLKDIQSAGVVRFAISDDDERLRSVAEHIAQSNGVRAEYIVTDKENAIAMLSSDAADIAVGYHAQSEGLKLDYIASLAFYNGSTYIVFNEGDHALCKEDTKDSLLGASDMLTSSVSSDIAELSIDETIYCTDADMAGAMLGNGTLDYFYCTETEAINLTERYPSLRCAAASDIEPEKYSVVMKKEDRKLYDAVNRAIGELLTGGNK